MAMNRAGRRKKERHSPTGGVAFDAGAVVRRATRQDFEESQSMHIKLIAVAGALVALSACETAPDDAGDAAAAAAAAAAEEEARIAAAQNDVATTVEPIQPPEARTPGDMLVDVGDRVFFDFDRHDIRPEGQTVLLEQAKLLRAYPNLTVTIAGHCDERGTREYNLALGERRAAAARNFLVEAGVDPERIRTISYGKERPIALGHTKAAWAQNRVAITTLN